ncbi:MAG: hypothetical protein AAFV19_08555 [Pseudomonadota bacterium]
MPEDADILAGLYGLREVPPSILDVIAALALGLVLAGLIGMGLSAFRGRSRRQRWQDRLAMTHSLPEPEKTLHLAMLLRDATEQTSPGSGRWTERAARRFEFDAAEISSLSEALYRPGETTSDRLSVMAERAVRTVGR